MKVLVTGATGFIGGEYVKHLCAAHPEVQVFFGGRDAERGNQLAVATGAHFYRGDLTDGTYASGVCKQIDAVVHCAGLTGVWGDYERYYRANVLTVEKLLSAATATGVRRFVNIGTPGIYFDLNDHLNVTEDFLPPRFADNYVRTKYQAETRVLRAHSEQLKTLSLRPRFVIGPGDVSLFPRLIRLHRNGQLKQLGEGRNIVSMTCLPNLMQALDCAVFGSDDVTGDVYNIADPEPVNFWQTINQLMQVMSLPAIKRKVPYPAAYAVSACLEAWHRLIRSRDEPTLMRIKTALLAHSFTLNVEKAQRQLGYQPLDNMTQTIEDFVRWYKNSPHPDKR